LKGDDNHTNEQADTVLQLFHRALDLQQSVLHDAHVIAMETMESLALVHSQVFRNNRKALQIYESMFQSQETEYGIGHLNCANILGKMSVIFIEEHELGKAVKCLERVLECQISHLGREHEDVMNTKLSIAKVKQLASRQHGPMQQMQRR